MEKNWAERYQLIWGNQNQIKPLGNSSISLPGKRVFFKLTPAIINHNNMAIPESLGRSIE
jgi:hypothetical protein